MQEQDARIQRLERDLEDAEQVIQDWERKFAEYAQNVMQTSRDAEEAARSMYETLWQQDREALIQQFMRRGKTLEQNLVIARQERDAALRSVIEMRDALNAYKAEEPARAKDARRQLAAEFAAEKERLAALNSRECQRLAGESRALRGKLEEQASLRSEIERRASELAIALTAQKRETEAAMAKVEEVRKCQERVRILEEYIRGQGERDYVRENERLSLGLRQSEEQILKLKSLYERSLATIRGHAAVKSENDQLRELATRITLENSKTSVDNNYLRAQLAQAEKTMEKMSENIEKMSVALLNDAADQEISEQNRRLRERVTEERAGRKECEAKLFAATKRFEMELEKERRKTKALPVIQN